MIKSEDRPEDEYEALKLKNQLCFPLYACSKEIVRAYKPYLDILDLTYTQYIVMMVLWERKDINVKALGEFLWLDSGTLTPVLKKLESKGYISRIRSSEDQRIVSVKITETGEKLREEASRIPSKMSECINLSPEEGDILYKLLYKILSGLAR